MKDYNTKYFHSIASLHRKHNLISCINIGGQELTEVDEIENGIKQFMQNSFKQEELPHIGLPPNSFKKLNSDSINFLEVIPLGTEIKDVV